MCNVTTEEVINRLREQHNAISDRRLVINAITRKSPSLASPLFDVLTGVGLYVFSGNQHNEKLDWNFQKLESMQTENLVDLWLHLSGAMDPSKIKASSDQRQATTSDLVDALFQSDPMGGLPVYFVVNGERSKQLIASGSPSKFHCDIKHAYQTDAGDCDVLRVHLSIDEAF